MGPRPMGSGAMAGNGAHAGGGGGNLAFGFNGFAGVCHVPSKVLGATGLPLLFCFPPLPEPPRSLEGLCGFVLCISQP